MCWKCGVLFGSRHSYDCMSSGIGRVLTSQSARVTQMNFVAAVNLGGGGGGRPETLRKPHGF